MTRGMRFTIEHLRTLLLVAAALLALAIVGSLAFGHYTRRFLRMDLPRRLGADIQVQADDFNYTQTNKGKTIFHIHAKRASQLKGSGQSLLHEVQIDLFGPDGNRTETIAGNDFVYDRTAGVAQANGQVTIDLVRPDERPAIAGTVSDAAPSIAIGHDRHTSTLLQSREGNALTSGGEIHIITSGLTFHQKTGEARTNEKLTFSLHQGSGSAVGALYDATHRVLTLDHDVEIHAIRPQGVVLIHAAHAELDRTSQQLTLLQSVTRYTSGTATVPLARVQFRKDGSVERLTGDHTIDLVTATGGTLHSAQGVVVFDEQNRPHQADFSGGVLFASDHSGSVMHGSAQSAHLDFSAPGMLSSAHLMHHVEMDMLRSVAKGSAESSEHRFWRSAEATIRFEPAEQSGKRAHQSPPNATGSSTAGQSVEPRHIEGNGGTTLDATDVDTRGRNQTTHLFSDTLTADLLPGSQLSHLNGKGHVSFRQATADGATESSHSDTLDAAFDPVAPGHAHAVGESAALDIATMVQSGNVILDETSSANEHAVTHATAGRLSYDSHTGIAHLTSPATDMLGHSASGSAARSPQVSSGGLELAATRIDIDRSTGDATADGAVKATVTRPVSDSGGGASQAVLQGGLLSGTGQSPAHIVADRAKIVHSSGNAEFTGHARLWREGDSIAAPEILVNQQKQTLTARGSTTQGVETTLVTANATAAHSKPSEGKRDRPRPSSVLQFLSAQLDYSDGERVAVFSSKPGSQVVMHQALPSGMAMVQANRIEVHLLPADVHRAGSSGGGGIDRLDATGNLALDWPGRRGTGDKLTYSGESDIYRLTGTSTQWPRMVDAQQGTVTGRALILYGESRAISVEGEGSPTVTETHVKR